MSDSLRPHGLHSPWNSPGQNTGVGSLSLLHGIFPTQGSNSGLPHCRQILYQLSQKGSPRILEWVAYPFSRGSSWLRNWTKVSGIAGGFFTNWTIREALIGSKIILTCPVSLDTWYPDFTTYFFLRDYTEPWKTIWKRNFSFSVLSMEKVARLEKSCLWSMYFLSCERNFVKHLLVIQ